MYPEVILPIAAHIPHAGTEIPVSVRDQFIARPSELWREIVTVTDWYTDQIFGMPGIVVAQTPISRVVTDLERYTDEELEPKAKFGQGVIYSHNTLGAKIRNALSEFNRHQLLENYYRPWHLKLESDIEQLLVRWGGCLLLDCHSFPDAPFDYEDDGGRKRPDICLGVSDTNTPEWLLEVSKQLFLGKGYSVEIDFPYAGCLIPNRFLNNPEVPAIMVEINRRLYLEPASLDAYRNNNVPTQSENFDTLRADIWSIILLLAQQLICRHRIQP